jgi:ABC-type transport system substrate-binding protein
VKFHDGTAFNADAVIWNLDKVKNKEAPQYDPKQAAEVIWRAPLVKSWRTLDDYTVEITTSRPSSTVLFQVCTIFYSSPSQWEKLGRDWSKVAQNPAGTGPFMFARLLPRERLELEAFTDYWDPRRVPKVDKLVLLPMPESTTRMAALRTRQQVDFIEVPPPNAIAGLKRDGFQGMVNVSFGFAEPFSAFTWFFHSDFAPPKSTNLSPYVNPEVDRLLDQVEITFDAGERDRLLAKVNEIVVDDAPWIFIVHDLNPRALSPKVKGFVQAQSWYQDLTLHWPGLG